MSFVERWMLGTLPFGDGLASRLRALKASRRWPAVLQGALVVALGGATVLASGERVMTMKPPTIAVISVETFGPLAPELAQSLRTGVASMESAREVLRGASTNADERLRRSTWAGYPASWPEAALTTLARIESGGLHLQATTAEATTTATLAEGEGLLVRLPADAVRIALVSVDNVAWDSGAVSWVHPSIDLHFRSKRLSEVASAFSVIHGLRLPLAAARDPIIDVVVDDASPEDWIGRLMDAGGLEIVSGGEAGWMLVPRNGSTSPIETIQEVARSAGATTVSVTPEAERLRVLVRLEGPAQLRALSDELRGRSFVVDELNVTMTDGALTALLHVLAPPDPGTKRWTLEAWALSRQALREILPASDDDGYGFEGIDPAGSPELEAKLAELQRQSRATSRRFVLRQGAPAHSINVPGGNWDGNLEFEIQGDATVTFLTASWKEARVSAAIAEAAAMALTLDDANALVILVKGSGNPANAGR